MLYRALALYDNICWILEFLATVYEIFKKFAQKSIFSSRGVVRNFNPWVPNLYNPGFSRVPVAIQTFFTLSLKFRGFQKLFQKSVGSMEPALTTPLDVIGKF